MTPEEQPLQRTRASLTSPLALGFALAIGVLIAVALATALVGVSTVIVSIVLALFLALGLDPLVSRFERAGIARGWGIAIVFTAFAVIVGLIIWLIVPRVIQQLVEFVQAVPDALAALASQEWFISAMEAIGADPVAVTEGVTQFLSDPERLLALTGGVVATGFGVIGGISSTVVIVALTLYMLASIEGMKSAFYRFTPAYSRPTVIRLTETITGSMGGFVMTMAVLGALNATLVMLLHVVLRLPFPALMGVIAFFLTLIPVVGSVLFWVVGTVVALFSDPVAALIFAVAYLVYMQVESYVLTPRLMGKSIAVPGILVLIGAMVGAALLGLLGALVAVPVVAAITLIVREVVFVRQDARTVRL